MVYSETAEKVAPSDFDAIIAVVGEGPYAEMKGDIIGVESLALSSRYPEDYAVLRKVSGHGKPVITLPPVDLCMRTICSISPMPSSPPGLPGTEG